jgi:hypothetical protein
VGYQVGAVVKKGTPPDVVKTLEEAFMKAANDPAFVKWARDTKTPAGEPYDSKGWGDHLRNMDVGLAQVMPMLEESLKKMQQGK